MGPVNDDFDGETFYRAFLNIEEAEELVSAICQREVAATSIQLYHYRLFPISRVASCGDVHRDHNQRVCLRKVDPSGIVTAPTRTNLTLMAHIPSSGKFMVIPASLRNEPCSRGKFARVLVPYTAVKTVAKSKTTGRRSDCATILLWDFASPLYKQNCPGNLHL